MATKKSNEAKVTLWTDTMKSEFKGTISACTIEMFGYIMPAKNKTAAEVREAALKWMQKKHEILLAEGR
jgi:hypothetical protein